ncbi:hypothetical protein DFH05DRAFT_1521310 [Lentinula detonsa]|uniref:Uncharacterized protein n=1 Tax=Lentinula detonsa TaxID=2804962 RepID=A0A9W8PA26_9AGAR|nr:hypothetical protein DFH05DRAFT_1521310 [Lentinula detonsa]
MPPNENPRLNESQSAHKTPIVSSPDKTNRKVPNQTTQSQGSPPRRSSTADSDEDMQRESEDEGSNTEHGPSIPRHKAAYNPPVDPGNTSMHTQREVSDVFTAGMQVLVTAAPNKGTTSIPGIPYPTPQVNSDDEQEIRRPNTRTIPFTNRTAMPALTLIKVNSFDEERTRIVYGTGENPHGRIEEPEAFYSVGEKLILQHCSANEGHFLKALFYPSYVFQEVTPNRVERYCEPDSGFLALIFFNGGNTLHTKYRKTVSDLTEFLIRIGCGAKDIQINAPFYQRPKTKENNTSQQSTSRSRGGAPKGKAKIRTNQGGLSPVGHPKENDKYIGPNTAFVKLESFSLQRKLLRFQTIAVSKTLTFHVITPSIIYRPWIVCTMFANTLKTSEYISDGIRWAIRKAIRDDPTLVNTIAECSGNMGTAQQRVQFFTDTIEVCNANYTATKEGQVRSAWLTYALSATQ